MNRPQALSYIDASILRLLADVFSGSVAEWCCANLRFDESSYHGEFNTDGFEYTRDVLDDFHREPELWVTDSVLVWGSQTRKTGTLVGGVAFAIVNDPCGMLWVMPSINLAQSFSETRWQPLLEASPGFVGQLPTGKARHDYKKLQQQIGASVVNFVGSNSPANLASRPARRVILDEVDKFDSGGSGEADAANLADQRTKAQINPQRWKTSTPTTTDGIIWQEYLKGNQMRYYLPCPHCAKLVILAWAERFTVIPKTGAEAYVFWDKEARTANGWDFDRVRRSAHAECPFCKGWILDGDKTKMIREGKWIATNPGAPRGFVSRHLSSLYSSSQDTRFGEAAVQFLQAKQSLMGLQGFINGFLAEPFEGQDRQVERVELISSAIEVGAEWRKLLTVDCQAKSPHFWYVVRAWDGGNSHGIEAGPVDTWEDLRSRQEANNVRDAGVIIDSGYGARDDAGVYRECARFCKIVDGESRPQAIGWMPAKGVEGRKRWKDTQTGLMVPYYLRQIDPFVGTSRGGKLSMNLFEFAGDYFKDVLAALRQKDAVFKWSVSPEMATEEYWKHLDAEIKTACFNKNTGRTRWEWRPRSSHWPNHLGDCEVEQVAGAMLLGWFNPDAMANNNQPTTEKETEPTEA